MTASRDMKASESVNQTSAYPVIAAY